MISFLNPTTEEDYRMNLIERARRLVEEHPSAIPPSWGKEVVLVLDELAGEVDRLWALEKTTNEFVVPHWQDILATRDLKVSELEAEIERLKGEVDHVALNRAWGDGYRRAAMPLTEILNNLLAIGQPEPPKDHPHEH